MSRRKSTSDGKGQLPTTPQKMPKLSDHPSPSTSSTYSSPKSPDTIKVFIFHVFGKSKYSSAQGEKAMVKCVVKPESQETTVLKVFTPESDNFLKEGKTIKLVNYITNKDCLVATKFTKFFLTAPLTIADEDRLKAAELMKPKATPLAELKIDSTVIAHGRIDVINRIREIAIRGVPTKVQDLTISDTVGTSVQVTVWRDVDISHFSIGQWIKLIDVKVGYSNYNSTVVLHVNSADQLLALPDEEIAHVNAEVTIDGLQKTDEQVLLSTTSGEEFSVEFQIFTKTCKTDSVDQAIDLLVQKLPLTTVLKMKAGKVSDFTFSQ